MPLSTFVFAYFNEVIYLVYYLGFIHGFPAAAFVE
jgi:hypothetical protein